jgi:YVTN family beta-propeller protein
LFTVDGKYGMVVSQGPGLLEILDPTANTVSKSVTVGKMPHWIAANTKGDTAWVTNEGSNDVSVVDLASGKVTATIPVGNAPRKIVIQPQTQAMGQGGVTTSIKGFAFESSINVKAGQAVAWTNADSVAHTVTSDTGVWDSGDVAPGASFSFTFNQPGTYAYHCMHHPYMKGEIVVTA